MDNRYYQPQNGPAQSNYVNGLQICNRRMLIYLLGVAWGSLSIGYSWAVTEPGFLNSATLFNTAIIDLIFYMPDVGGIFGALTAGFLCDRYGRRVAILAGATINLVATGILTASVNLAMFFVFEFFVGFGAAILLVSIPVWIAETAPPRGRAILISVHPISMLLGGCLEAWIGWSLSHGVGLDSTWRASTGIGCMWPFLCLLSCFFLPESPRWLLRCGREDQAWKTVARLHYKPEDDNRFYPRLEFEHMTQRINAERATQSGYGALLAPGYYLPRTFIACALSFFVLSSGIAVITVYNYSLWTTLGYSSASAFVLRQCAWDSAIVGMSILALLVIEKMPRRSFIIIGFLGTLFSIIAYTGIVGGSETEPYAISSDMKGFAIGGIFVTYVFGLFYAGFLYGSKFFYAAEIFPNQLRAKGMALAMVTLSVTDILWLVATSYAFATITWKFFIVFIGLSAIAITVLGRILPDTRGMPLEDIGRLFGEYGPSNNGWNIAQNGDAGDNAWNYAHSANSYHEMGSNNAPTPHEVDGSYRVPELHGMQETAEAHGVPRYEMHGRSQPAQLGGENVFEVAAANSRRNSRLQQK